MENMKKSNEKKQEKGMNRTEFAQEYSMDVLFSDPVSYTHLTLPTNSLV